LHAKRNETGVFQGVTGKALRPAPPYTVSNRKEPFNINGLHVSQNRPETVFSNNRLPFTTLQNRSNRPALL